MNTFQQDLEEAVAYHGHLCIGQIVGVLTTRLALKTLGVDDPKNFRDLIVYVECDRCITDAISTVTGCHLGYRNLKFMDYGKVAASFLNLQTGEAVRISSKTRVHPPDDVNPVEFFLGIPEDELFHVARVKIHYRPEDLPGKPRNAMICPTCGEEVIDGRQVIRDSIAVCKACADGAYYELEDLNDNC